MEESVSSASKIISHCVVQVDCRPIGGTVRCDQITLLVVFIVVLVSFAILATAVTAR